MNIIHFIFIFMQDCKKHDIQSYLQEVLIEILAVWNPDLLPVCLGSSKYVFLICIIAGHRKLQIIFPRKNMCISSAPVVIEYIERIFLGDCSY